MGSCIVILGDPGAVSGGERKKSAKKSRRENEDVALYEKFRIYLEDPVLVSLIKTSQITHEYSLLRTPTY